MPNGSLTGCLRDRSSVWSQDNYCLLLHKLWGSLWKRVDVIALILSAGYWCCYCQLLCWAAAEEGLNCGAVSGTGSPAKSQCF